MTNKQLAELIAALLGTSVRVTRDDNDPNPRYVADFVHYTQASNVDDVLATPITVLGCGNTEEEACGYLLSVISGRNIEVHKPAETIRRRVPKIEISGDKPPATPAVPAIQPEANPSSPNPQPPATS